MTTKTRLEKLEERMRGILAEHDQTVAMLEMQDKRQAQAEAEKAKAMERLPELREREAELWAMHDAAIDTLDEAITGIGALRPELVKAWGRPRRVVHNRIKLAVKAELQQQRLRRRLDQRALAGDDEYYEAEKKRRIAHLERVLKEQKDARREMAGGADYPAMAGIGVTTLWQPEAMIEIAGTAAAQD